MYKGRNNIKRSSNVGGYLFLWYNKITIIAKVRHNCQTFAIWHKICTHSSVSKITVDIYGVRNPCQMPISRIFWKGKFVLYPVQFKGFFQFLLGLSTKEMKKRRSGHSIKPHSGRDNSLFFGKRHNKQWMFIVCPRYLSNRACLAPPSEYVGKNRA